jgi:hypothetical protein
MPDLYTHLENPRRSYELLLLTQTLEMEEIENLDDFGLINQYFNNSSVSLYEFLASFTL